MGRSPVTPSSPRPPRRCHPLLRRSRRTRTTMATATMTAKRPRPSIAPSTCGGRGGGSPCGPWCPPRGRGRARGGGGGRQRHCHFGDVEGWVGRDGIGDGDAAPQGCGDKFVSPQGCSAGLGTWTLSLGDKFVSPQGCSAALGTWTLSLGDTGTSLCPLGVLTTPVGSCSSAKSLGSTDVRDASCGDKGTAEPPPQGGDTHRR